MKKSFFAPVVFLFLITSCSLFNSSLNSSYLTFSIDNTTASQIKKSAAEARNAYRDATEETKPTEQSPENIFIEIVLSGDYEELRIIPIEENAVITFTDLQEGQTITAQGTVYSIERKDDGTDSRIDLYSGKSEKMTLRRGSNQMDLELKKITSAEPETVDFVVKYYLQNVEGEEYTFEKSETLHGASGSKTEVVAPEYKGFKAKEIAQQEIKADGSTEVLVYYDRNVYKVTYADVIESADGSEEIDEENIKVLYEYSYRYGATVTVAYDDIDKIEGHEGYYFVGWTADGEVVYYSDKEEVSTFVMGDEDVILVAIWMESESPKESAVIKFTIQQDELSDITVAVTIDDAEFTGSGTLAAGVSSVVIFTADSGYSSYVWKVNGEVVDASTTGFAAADNVLRAVMSDLPADVIYDITLLADDYSYSAQIKKN